MRTGTAYSIAFGSLGAALGLRWLLDPLLGPNLPFVTIFGAVAIGVWAGGYKPAALVAALGWVSSMYLFGPHRYEPVRLDATAGIGLFAYALTCLIIVVIGAAMRSAQAYAAERGELVRVTLGSIGDAVITTDTQARVTYLNAVAEELTGWRSAEAIGEKLDTVISIVNEHTRHPVPSPVTRALQEGTVVGLANHTLLIAKDGVERPIDDSAAPIKNATGQTIGCVLIFRDVTERRRWERDEAEQLLTARRLAAIVESSDDAIVAKSLDGVITSWNAGAERLFGFTASEAIGRHITLVIPPERIGEEDQIIARLKSGQRVDHFETVRVRKDGRSVHVSLTVSPIFDAEGRVVGASKIARDISERIRFETERQKFVTLIENGSDFVAMCDMQGAITYLNPAGLRMLGLDQADLAAVTNLREFFFVEDQASVWDGLLPTALRSGDAETDIRFCHRPSGEALWISLKILAIREAETVFGMVGQNITERRKLEGSLRTLAADLSEANHRKSEFLATLAHELRNPLAPLRNLLEVLKRDGDEETRSRAVTVMQRQLEHLVRLVDDLLDLNRINHGRMELRKGIVDVSTIVTQAVESSREICMAMDHQIATSLPPEPLHVDADEIRLTQVLSNLLNNSCKYTNRGGRIEVTVHRDGSQVVIAVRDNGIGIPPERLQDIFGMFMQLEPALQRSRGGLGIGLMLVKRLVEMQGGTVTAHSDGVGQGSEFIVHLPLAAAPRTFAQVPGPAIADDAGGNTLPHRIVVVDDNRDAASSLAQLLHLTGHDAYVAYDGPSALELIEREQPDVVLLDIGLPGLNGYEVCRRVRKQPWGAQMHLIALTGWGQEKDLQESREAGFDGHLVKPVDYRALEDALCALSRP